MGMIQLLQMTDLTPEQTEYCWTAVRSSKRLTGLLSDLLDLSRIEAGKMNLHYEALNLSETLGHVWELFRPSARQAGVELTFNVDSSVPDTLMGDAARLQQVLGNLAGNALKFTESGVVSIGVSPAAAKHDGEARVLFTIEDTGIGIPDDKLDVLFESFTQASEGYARRYQGAGLGLPICKRIVELMDGEICVASEPGKGTAVYFTASFGVDGDGADSGVADPEPEAEREHAPVEVAGLDILLAEDDRVSAFVIMRQLEKAGCRVTLVEDGEQVLEALRKANFDLVLMDVQMPVMDGVEATRAIRSGEAGKDKSDVPVAALTAYAMNGDEEQFRAAGMNYYLSKPLEVEALYDVLERVVREFG
jgi:CheY-like chemotaxis protein